MQNKVNSPLRRSEQIRIQAATRDCRKFNQFPTTVNCRYSSQSESSHIIGLGRGRGAARLSPHWRTNAFGRARAYTQDAWGTKAGKGGGGWLGGGRGGLFTGEVMLRSLALLWAAGEPVKQIESVAATIYFPAWVWGESELLRIHTWREQRALCLCFRTGAVWAMLWWSAIWWNVAAACNCSENPTNQDGFMDKSVWSVCYWWIQEWMHFSLGLACFSSLLIKHVGTLRLW